MNNRRMVEFFRRWGIGRPGAEQYQGAIDVGRSVQPVAIVDDLTALSLDLPNIIVTYGGFGGTATIGQHDTFLLIPGRLPVRVRRMRLTTSAGSFAAGVRSMQQIARPTLESFDTSSPMFLQEPPIPDDQKLIDAEHETGTTATQLWSEANGFYLSNTLIEMGNLVFPGQYFFCQPFATNVGLAVNLVEWEQLAADVYSRGDIPQRAANAQGRTFF